jgi:3-oxoacyl-[acyl-carrier-protein] synthase III
LPAFSIGQHKRQHGGGSDIQAGEFGVICSFGAGYSIGSVLLRRS